MLRKNRKKLISLLMLVLFTVLVVRVNRVTKTELVSRNGQTFEKAVVEEILTDNLQADGSVRIPEVLQPYMGGNKEITPKNK